MLQRKLIFFPLFFRKISKDVLLWLLCDYCFIYYFLNPKSLEKFPKAFNLRDVFYKKNEKKFVHHFTLMHITQWNQDHRSPDSFSTVYPFEPKLIRKSVEMEWFLLIKLRKKWKIQLFRNSLFQRLFVGKSVASINFSNFIFRKINKDVLLRLLWDLNFYM